MPNPMALVWDLVAVDHASGTFSRVGGEAESTAGSVRKVLEGFGALAVGGAIIEATKQAAEFQKQMTLVQTQAGASAQEVRNLGPAILSLSGHVAQAPEALANSLYHVESTGLRGKAALDAVTVAAEGARVGNADLEQTTNALTATIASGMLPATEKYSQAMGQLNTIVGSGDMKMSDLNESLSTGLLVTVKQYGVNLNDVGAALADFGDNNLRGADAATKLRMAVQAIESPAKNAQAQFDRIHITAKQLADDMATGGLNKALTDLHTHLVNSGIAASQWGQLLTDAFTKKAGAGVLTLIGTFDRFEQKYQEVSKGANTFGNAWTATTKTASFQFAQLKDTVDALGIKVGEKLLPVFGDVSSWLVRDGIPDVQRFGKELGGWMNTVENSSAWKDFWSTAKTLFVDVRDDVEKLVTSFSRSGGLHDVLLGVQVVGGLALGALKGLVTVGESTLGTLVHWFTELPGPVQATAVAFVALRAATAAGLFDKLIGSEGSVLSMLKNVGSSSVVMSEQMRTSFGVAKQAQLDLMGSGGLGGSLVSRATANMAGLGAAAGEVAKGGLSALKTAGSGVLNVLGGAWGATLLGAGVAVSLVAAKFEQGSKDTKDWTAALEQGGQAAADAQAAMDKQNAAQAKASQGFMGWLANIDGFNAAQKAAAGSTRDATAAAQAHIDSLNGVDRAQYQVNQDLYAYNQAADRYGPASAQAESAAGRLRTAQDGLASAQERENRAQQTHIDLLHQAAQNDSDAITMRLQMEQAQANLNTSLAQYNQDAADGQHNTSDLNSESNNLALQMIQTAKQVGDQAGAQAKANGITDDGTLATQAQLDWLGKVASQIKGPGHDAVVQYMNDLGKANVVHGDLNDAISKLGLNVVGTWNNNTKEISGATSQEIQDLKNLGLNVLALPGMPGHPANILVTANTDPAYNTLNDFVKKAQQLGFVGAVFNLTPLAAPSTNVNGAGRNQIPGLPPIPGKATGGAISGAGTSTSDSILIAASNGEHMWSTAEVNAAGGHGAVAAMRAAVLAAGRGFAQGGAIWPADWNQSLKNGWAASLTQQTTNNPYVGTVAGATSQAAVQLAARMSAAAGWTGNEWTAFFNVGMRESGWNPYAVNKSSGAYGIPQALGHGHPFNLGDTQAQISWMIDYIRGRYGDPINAWAHEQSAGWYDGGGWLKNGMVGANKSGRPEAVLDPDQSQAFTTFASALAAGGLEVTGTLQIGGDGLGRLVDARLVQHGKQQRLTAAAGSSSAMR